MSTSTLRDVLTQASTRIQSGDVSSDVQVRQYVVTPILRVLGWDDTNPQEVAVEARCGDGLIDYQIDCGEAAVVWIYVSSRGHDLKYTDRMIRPVLTSNVVFVASTDGDRWRFIDAAPTYATGGCFVEANATEDVEALADILEMIASKRVLSTQDGRDTAVRTLRNKFLQTRMQQAWRDIVDEGDLVPAFENHLLGLDIQNEDIKAFLSSLASDTPSTEKDQTERMRRTAKPRIRAVHVGSETISVQPPNNKNAMLEVLLYLQARDRDFLRSMYRHASNASQRHLHPFLTRDSSRVETVNAQRRISKGGTACCYSEVGDGSGWFVYHNLSRDAIIKKLKIACEVAGLRYGENFRIELDADSGTKHG